MRQAGEGGFKLRPGRWSDDMGPGWTVANAEPRAGDGGLWGTERGRMRTGAGRRLRSGCCKLCSWEALMGVRYMLCT